MSRELNFTGWWEGDAVYYCDECGKRSQDFPFDSSDIDSKGHRSELRQTDGWITIKIGGKWHDFCCEKCRNAFIKKHG